MIKVGQKLFVWQALNFGFHVPETPARITRNPILISEVLRSIVDCLAEDTVWCIENLVDEDTDKAARRALAVLARTCRAFSKPALDALWRKLQSLEPFILCLPTRAWYDFTEDGALV